MTGGVQSAGAAEIERRIIDLLAEREAVIRAEIERAAALPLPVNCRCLASMARPRPAQASCRSGRFFSGGRRWRGRHD